MTHTELMRDALSDIEQAHDLSLDLDNYASRQVLVSLADKIKTALAASQASATDTVVSPHGSARLLAATGRDITRTGYHTPQGCQVSTGADPLTDKETP